MNKENIAKIIEILENDYQEVKCTLNYNSPLELLVATMLSAQCTDARVNIVTPKLFNKYRSPKDFMEADIFELENFIRSTGFFRNKSNNIKKCCSTIVKDFEGKIPSDMNELVKLPGVGRKTANVFLGEIYTKPGIVVDTHAKRLANRIGLTKESNPEKIEQELMKKIPKEKWTTFSHRLVYHGRAVCNARSPKCEICNIKEYCEYYKKTHQKRHT